MAANSSNFHDITTFPRNKAKLQNVPLKYLKDIGKENWNKLEM